jgi:hypothetical protein
MTDDSAIEQKAVCMTFLESSQLLCTVKSSTVGIPLRY